MESKCYSRLPSGRYVPSQPCPFYDLRQWLRSWLCVIGRHSPGAESEGWFCAVCLKQLKEDDGQAK